MNNLNIAYEDITDYVDYNSKLTIDMIISKFALENSNIGVWDYNPLNNTVNYSNEAKKILELEHLSKNSISYNWQEAIHPEDLPIVLEKLSRHYSNETQNYTSEHRILTKEGNYKWVKDIGKVVSRDAKGNLTRVIGTTIDINERKEQEAKLIDKQTVISKQNKKLKNFAFIATHNLKSHAANFESLLNFHDEAEIESEKIEILIHLRSVSDALTKTIKNLNKIVSTGSVKNDNIQMLNIKSFALDTIKFLDVKIKEAQAVIKIDFEDNLCLEYNPTYLESILQNLISNAIKYRHPDRTPIINLTSKRTKDYIILKFSDNGLGIDLEKYGDHMFELYKTFHKNENAEGVGLYLTKNQIEAFGGSIKVESQVGIGSTFIIKFPNKKSLV
ncbi:sensor histidine kinase [Lacinutrix chionoecetis]